ncbi:alpha/beta hydrolase [candidate division WWE3 bacterium]|uniref:Alpha/beta hydrolase n=1 Tax=candidate division WWE3 bacterium TaxID=2053526 RepID=A0A955RR75_UNCKA|nr:alpha/beta hydrolase [candidate division WWE3 bacterium]
MSARSKILFILLAGAGHGNWAWDKLHILLLKLGFLVLPIERIGKDRVRYLQEVVSAVGGYDHVVIVAHSIATADVVDLAGYDELQSGKVSWVLVAPPPIGFDLSYQLYIVFAAGVKLLRSAVKENNAVLMISGKMAYKFLFSEIPAYAYHAIFVDGKLRPEPLLKWFVFGRYEKLLPRGLPGYAYVVVPMRDAMVPARFQLRLAGRLGAEVFQIVGAPHDVMFTHPESLARVLQEIVEQVTGIEP